MKATSERFWSKVDTSGDCWVWTGTLGRGGYPHFGLRDGVTVRAHRWLYEQTVGPIPLGLDLDHVCRNRACVNPDHLEPVTRGENLRRGYAARGLKDACAQQHAFTPENTFQRHDGGRGCRTCRNNASRASKARARAARAATQPNPILGGSA